MKVALLGNNYPPEFIGGTERVMQALARSLREQGDDVLVICGSEQPLGETEVVQEQVEGVLVYRLPLATDETYDLNVPRPRLRGQVQELLQSWSADIVHVHHWSHLSDGLLQLCRALSVPAIATLHDLWTSCPRFFREPPDVSVTCPTGSEREPCVRCVAPDYGQDTDRVRQALTVRDRNLRQELASAARLTAPSHSCAAAITRHTGYPGSIEVVPHGLLEPAVRTPRERSEPVRVGTFGNLVPSKGTSELVAAMANVEGADLHLFGRFPDPSYRDRLQHQARELGVGLTIHGPYDHGPGEHRPDEQARHPAQDLDLAVFFSRCEETYGLVIDEALARGVPVIASDRGALPERIRGGGLIVGSGDVESLHKEIQSLVADPQRWLDLRDQIPGSFPTIHDAARRYRALYRDAISS